VKKTKVLALEYKQFPLVNLPHVLVDLGRDLLIAALIVLFFGKDLFGLYNHSYMILRLPMIIVGASIGQVFFNKCSELVQNGNSTYNLMKRTLLILFGLSIVPFSIIFFFGEPLFSFVFSEAWAKSGYYSEIMTIWLMMNFMISPLSSLPLVLKRQKEFFFIGTFASITQVFCFFIFPFLWGDSEAVFESMLWTLSISQAVILFCVIFITLYYSKKGVKTT
jgi:O-antigen/teichoic acid export membrane protein